MKGTRKRHEINAKIEAKSYPIISSAVWCDLNLVKSTIGIYWLFVR